VISNNMSADVACCDASVVVLVDTFADVDMYCATFNGSVDISIIMIDF